MQHLNVENTKTKNKNSSLSSSLTGQSFFHRQWVACREHTRATTGKFYFGLSTTEVVELFRCHLNVLYTVLCYLGRDESYQWSQSLVGPNHFHSHTLIFTHMCSGMLHFRVQLWWRRAALQHRLRWTKHSRVQ